MAKRYSQLVGLITKVKPLSIVEVGVHRGVRAQLMCKAAIEIKSPVQYTGFDVFDSVDAHFHNSALNGKGAPSLNQAHDRLKSIAGLRYEFIVGDTRDTLAGRDIAADFAFIDGDHRVETIRSDYKALQGCRCVVFDDYYTPGGDGALPYLSRYGANAVIDEILVEGRNVDILPMRDICNHGAYTQLVVVWNQ